MSVGQKYGIRNAGYYALRSLRIEKFFAFWGQDLNTLTTPMECGGESRVKLEKVLFFQIPPLCLSAEQCDLSKIIRKIRKDREVLASGKSQGGEETLWGAHLLMEYTRLHILLPKGWRTLA